MIPIKVIVSVLSLTTISYASDLIANLSYGESRTEVAKKLNASKLVSGNIDASLIARIGLNGTFTTTKKLKGLKFSLYFDWRKSGGLREITYRSETLPHHNYNHRLKQTWEYAINLLSAIHGKARNAGEYPAQADVKPDNIQFSHEWRTGNGFVYLGVGQENNKYSINITFSKILLSD